MEHTLVPVVEGVVGAVADLRGSAICNSGAVDLGDGLLLFDTGITVRAAQELRTQLVEHFRREPTIVANSHWHLDHMLGNPAFGGLPIWGTRRTREIVLSQGDAIRAELSRASLENELRLLEARRNRPLTPGAEEDLEFVRALLHALLSEAGQHRLVPPDQTFETRVRIPGHRAAELVSFGPGHTEADAALWLPSERVLFAGDLAVSGVQPSLGSGDPEHWLLVLDELERLRPEVVVPGHGPVLTSDPFAETRGYLAGVLSAALSPDGAALPGPIARWEGSVSLEENVRFVRSLSARG